MSRFFTSDLHFGHKNVIQFCNRPVSSVEEMDDWLVNNWNSVVWKHDTVWILGDFFFCGKERAKNLLGRMNGEKHWVLGNHDWGKIPLHRAAEFGITSMGFSKDLILGEKHDVQMSHFPYTGDHTESDRFMEHRPKDDGRWLLHGHVHCGWKVRDRQINVGVDVWNWTPVSEEEIVGIIERGGP